MNEPAFNARPNDSLFTRRGLPHRVEKLVGDDWVKMSDWAQIDEERLQRHARALGGTVRLVTGGNVAREWRHGAEVGP